VLEALRLSGLRKRHPRDLSGGETQRVSIARAVVDPKAVLLLDEIDAGLDQVSRRAMREYLVSAAREHGIAVVFVSHNDREAFGLASLTDSRIGVMRDGKLVQVGTSEALYSHPQSTFVATLAGEATILEIEAGRGDTVVTKGGLTLPSTAGEGIASGFVAIRPEGISFSRQSPDSMQIRGVAEYEEFLGPERRVTFRVNQERLTMKVPHGSAEHVTRGQILDLYLSASALHFLDR
jgi:ABC-type Fe3+/spermidine/putrescine transport system ATPase subunit